MSYGKDYRDSLRGWRGAIERYDLIKEGILATIFVGALLVLLATVFGSPRIASVSFQSWANAAPADFANAALSELNGTSETATYGPPYNNGTGQLQSIWGISFQKIGGTRMPINAPEDLVLKPLARIAPLNPELRAALDRWNAASVAERNAWAAASAKATLAVEGDKVTLTGDETGPIADMITAMLTAAKSGLLTSQTIDNPDGAYSMNYTKSLLFIEDSPNYLNNIAAQYHLGGEQWGVTNELGSWPGQPWLWFYSFFYQVPPWKTAGTDISVIVTVTPLFALVLFLPWIPGLRSLPRWLGVYRLIWRDYYKNYPSNSRKK